MSREVLGTILETPLIDQEIVDGVMIPVVTILMDGETLVVITVETTEGIMAGENSRIIMAIMVIMDGVNKIITAGEDNRIMDGVDSKTMAGVEVSKKSLIMIMDGVIATIIMGGEIQWAQDQITMGGEIKEAPRTTRTDGEIKEAPIVMGGVIKEDQVTMDGVINQIQGQVQTALGDQAGDINKLDLICIKLNYLISDELRNFKVIHFSVLYCFIN